MQLSDYHREQQSSKLLDAISTLKRAIGIADHPVKPDCFGPSAIKGGARFLHVYTADPESAEILGNIFHKICTDGRSPQWWQKQAEKGDKRLKDYIEVNQVSAGCYETKMPIEDLVLKSLKDNIQKSSARHIGPTNAGRGR